MKGVSYLFKNSAEIINNDVVLPGYPYLLEGYKFNFRIKPKSNFWRFGIRLSKTEKIHFYHPEVRYKKGEFEEHYMDIHLGVGDWNNKNWSNPQKLQLIHYNQNLQPDVLQNTEDYQSQSEINWALQINKENKELYISTKVNSEILLDNKIPIDQNFKYFKVFAWADAISFELECELTVIALDADLKSDINPTAVKVGNIIFREGDMFDSDALKNTNVVLLPASTDGSASSNILNRASELGIPYPSKNKAGTVTKQKTSYEGNLEAGYAFSVDGFQSNLDIISQISGSIVNELNKNQSRHFNIPLFGTGAGGLNPIEVAKIYDQEFNNNLDTGEIIVSIPNETIFHEVKNTFLGKYIPLQQSSSISKSNEIIELENQLGFKLDNSLYRLDESGKLYYLNLTDKTFDAKYLKKHKTLKVLSINNSTIHNALSLSFLKNLDTLYCSGIELVKYDFLTSLVNMTTLDLSFNNLSRITFLKNLKKLKSLYLKGNNIDDISSLNELSKIEVLDISHNSISEIDYLSTLKQLRNLNISHNRISQTDILEKMNQLEILDISNNNIQSIAFLNTLFSLKYLKADRNPFVKQYELQLIENENQLPPIKNLLQRQNENGTVQLRLPVKVLLLGNHASGKSSFLGYIHSKHLRSATESTHIIKIEKYPKGKSGIPEAIFFDFGGQDYYHGIYKAFLSSGSIYIVLWNHEYNNNNQRTDINGITTQNFSLQYWLSQKHYLESEHYDGKVDPILLVQTYADRDKRRSFYDPTFEHDINNEFFVSLKQNTNRVGENSNTSANELALKYLNASLFELIEEKRIIKLEPEWYVTFLEYILNQDPTEGYIAKQIDAEILPHYMKEGEDNSASLRIELDQLHQKGLILYYKNELPDIVWLNPSALANYVHSTILDRNKVQSGHVPFADFSQYDQNVLQLLILQKVIFLHEFGRDGQEYIIPNFLPLATDETDSFSLYTFGFGNPNFSLKFKNFIPFGLINQIICFFGVQQDQKKFWRDQLIFTLEGKAKVLIRLDFKTLEIKVFVSYLRTIKDSEKNDIIKYLFYGILGLYWDVELFDYKDFIKYKKGELRKEDAIEGSALFKKMEQYDNLYQNSACRPLDLYLSVDDEYYVKYSDLCKETDSVSINANQIDGNRDLTEAVKIIPIHPFQPFANQTFRKRKKVVISYSKKDLELVNKFKDYLISLHDDELIEDPWYCTELIGGREWNDEIERKFNEADIIFFMISENLMATQYVKENEIKNAIDRWNRDKSIRIFPIILVHYHFARKGNYDLSKFVAFPYTLKPVTDFKDQHIAWHLITESIRIMIENDIDPGSNNGKLTSEQKRLFERIIQNDV